MVTVEVRAREKVQDLKTKAHQQLAVWARFCDELGSQAELPPLKDCKLSRASNKEVLDDRKRLAHCGLENGDELHLGTDHAVVSPDLALNQGQLGQEIVPILDEPEDMCSPIVHLLVAHALGEVNIEARRSETVLSVKKRALEQLDVWCRFTDVCNDGSDSSAKLPALEVAKLYASGSGDGLLLPQPLVESCSLAQCGLQAGAKLFLRAS
ncbi:Hypothetical protein SCF082_LOCUS28351 [Durusdinium trenchii]